MFGRIARAGAVVLGLLAPAGSAAQQTPQEQAAAVARTIFAALTAQRWNDVAGYVDSAALTRFRHRIIQQAWATTDYTYRPPRPDPNMPACVADYLKLHQPPPTPPVFSREQLLGFDTAEELERVAPVALLARYLEWNDEGNRARRMSPGMPVTTRTTRTVLGAVMASDSVALVVYDAMTYAGGIGSGGYDRVSLLELVRRGASWKIATPDALTGYSPGIVLASNAFAVGYGVMGSSELLLAPGRTAADTTAAAPRADRPKKPE